MTRALTLADRAEILKLADACADNKDGFGFAFYNASVVRFAIAISRMCAATAQPSDVRIPTSDAQALTAALTAPPA